MAFSARIRNDAFADDVLLFAKQSLGGLLGARTEKAAARLRDWDADAFLAVPEADAVEVLVAEGSVTCPVMHRDEVWMPPPSELLASRRRRRPRPAAAVARFASETKTETCCGRFSLRVQDLLRLLFASR